MMATSIQAMRENASTGFHYDPWRKATLTDGREVWIVRQDGDGTSAWYFTDDNEKISSDEIEEWKS
jgi:hypothetical protein